MLLCGQWIQNMGIGYVRESMGVEITLKKISSSGDYEDRYTIIDINARDKIYLNQKIGIGYRKWKGNGGDGSYIEIEMGTISATRLPDYHVCVDEDTKSPYVEPEPEPENEETIMSEIEYDCKTSVNLSEGDTFVHNACVIDILSIIDTDHVYVRVYPLYEGAVYTTLLQNQETNFRDFQVPFRITATTIFTGTTLKHCVLKVCNLKDEPEPEPGPEPGGYIGNITHEFSGDEIKIFVPVTNIWTKEICCYVDLRDQSGEFVEKAPMLLQTLKLLPGQSGLITIDSYGAINPSWDVNTVKGQTVSIELKGIGTVIGMCSPPPIGYTILHTKPFEVPMPPLPDPEPDDTIDIGDYIGNITHEFSGNEIKITAQVTNTWSKQACFFAYLMDQNGTFIENAPTPLQLKLSPGESGELIFNSDIPLPYYDHWNADDVQGQTISIDLYGLATVLGYCLAPPMVGHIVVHKKTYDVPMSPEPGPEPDPEPDGSGTIGEISKEITPQIGNDEVKFSIPITNNTSKEQCYILKLFDANGDYIAKTPTSIIPGQMANKIVAGGTETMVLDSIGQFWHINDIEGQTVTFKLFGDPSFLTICPYFESGYSEVDSKTYVMESYVDPDKGIFDPGDLFDVDPEFDVPMVNVNKVAFKGIGNPNETIYIKVDRSLEIDEIITSFECGPDGKFSGEHDFDTGSYKLYAKKLGALGKESERHTVLVIDIIHLALLVIALGLTIWKIRRK